MRALLPAIILVGSIVAISYLLLRAQPVTEPTNQNPTASSSASSSGAPAANPVATIDLEKGGVIKIELFPKLAPKTVANFTAKANSGFYDNLTFHRVEDWVVQGGDPLGNGTGGGTQPTEINPQPFKIGAVGVARGNDISVSNDAQFFIVKQDADWLDGQYTNFGQVTAGLDVLDGIQVGDKIRTIRVQ